MHDGEQVNEAFFNTIRTHVLSLESNEERTEKSIESEQLFDGKLVGAHPRVVLPELRGWNGKDIPPVISERLKLFSSYEFYKPVACARKGLLDLVSCWVVTGQEQSANEAIKKVINFNVERPKASGNYGNVWKLVIAYDLLFNYSGLTNSQRTSIEQKIETALRTYIELLETDSPSLWHGRANLASIAWICAVVLDGSQISKPSLILKSQQYFLDIMRALALTEGWPEGYTYWINDRGFIIALASAAYLNGLTNSKNQNTIREVLRRVGYWMAHATRPDNKIEGFGDEGSRTDLKDETRRVIDIIAELTSDSKLALYSLFIGSIHGQSSYFRDYAWGFFLFNNPMLLPNNMLGQAPSLDSLKLESSELFGRDAFNQIFIRSSWDENSTFMSFRSGDIFTHHGHYDAGHFTLFKGAPLIVNSSTYGAFKSENRLNYSIRTIAKNSLLVLREKEIVRPNRFFVENVIDGGQRVILPTGSAIRNIQHWQSNIGKGLHLEGGDILYYDFTPGVYTYILSDITQAYNTPSYDEGGEGGKVRKARRSLMYLYEEDVLLVFDELAVTDKEFIKKWVGHTVNKPLLKNYKVLVGDDSDGILESSDDEFFVSNKNGRLVVNRLYPEDALVRLVGGGGYQYYVEVDGNERLFDGINMKEGASSKPWFDVANWRFEIQPQRRKEKDHFLISFVPSLDEYREGIVKKMKTLHGDVYGVEVGNTGVIFIDSLERGPVVLEGNTSINTLFVLGLSSGVDVGIQLRNKMIFQQVDNNGVLKVQLDESPSGAYKINWGSVSKRVKN